MHNLHLVVVNAENAKDAMHNAEMAIFEWGNENNWRTMCGAVSENDEMVATGNGPLAITITALDWSYEPFR